MSLAGLRRSAQKMGGGSGGKGKGKGGYWAKWDPPSFDKIEKNITPQEAPHVAEPIVLIEGEYSDPYSVDKVTGQPEVHSAYHYRFHRYQKTYQNKRSFRMMGCSRGPDQHNPKQCVMCLLVDNKEFDEKSGGARSNWVFNIAHLVPYHSVPLVKDNQIQMKKGTNEPIMVDRDCRYGTVGQKVYARQNNKQCDGCNAQAPMKMGSHRYWQLGKNHLEALFDFNDKVLGKVCFYTGTGIIHVGFGCSKCNMRYLDIAASGFTNEQIKQFSENPQRCGQCGHVGLPVSEYESGYTEGGYSKIPNFQMPLGPDGRPCKARPLNLFDVVLWVQREGENMDSKPVITRWCRLTEFPWNNGQKVDITKYVNETIVPNPFDFDEIFSIDTETQAKLLDRPNPYSAHQQQQNFQRYGQGPQGGYAGPVIPPPQQPGVQPQWGQPPSNAAQMPQWGQQQPAQPQWPNQQYQQHPQTNQYGQPNQGYGTPAQMPPQQQIAQPYPQQGNPQQGFPAPISPPRQPQQPGMPGFPQGIPGPDDDIPF